MKCFGTKALGLLGAPAAARTLTWAGARARTRALTHAHAGVAVASCRTAWVVSLPARIHAEHAAGAAGLHTSARCSSRGSFTHTAEEEGDAEWDAEPAAGKREAAGGRGRGQARERRGRAFLDPRAPRRQDHIRAHSDHAAWGGMVDVLEHAAYCDGQREEDPDGFFFDGVVPEMDSDCEGDPFSNGYLTEDEYEFPAEYSPAPYVPGRIADQIYFLYTMRKWPIQRLCAAFHVSSERVSAILALAHTQGQMIAQGMYTTKVDELMEQFYGDRFKLPGNASSKDSKIQKAMAAAGASAQSHTHTHAHTHERTHGMAGQDNFAPDYDLGVNYELLRDDQMPDDVFPIRRAHGTSLRMGHRLPPVAPPERKARAHASRFVFASVSGRSNNKAGGRPMVVSEWDGSVHPATNRDAIYRSWETRYWNLAATKGKAGYPFPDEDADKPANFRIVP